MRYLIWTSVLLYIAELFLGYENSHASPPFFLWAERVIAVIFTGEIFYRIYSSIIVWNKTGKDDYHIGFFIIDVISVLPFWVGFFVPQEWLRTIRALRVLRLLKLFRYNKSLQLFALSVYNVRKKLQSLAFVFFVLLIFQMSVLYEVEGKLQPDKFGDPITNFYACMAGATTQGWGDVTPVTPLGKFLVGTVFTFGFIVIVIASGCIADSYSKITGED